MHYNQYRPSLNLQFVATENWQCFVIQNNTVRIEKQQIIIQYQYSITTHTCTHIKNKIQCVKPVGGNELSSNKYIIMYLSNKTTIVKTQ